MTGGCVICNKEARIITNGEPLCKIHFTFAVWYAKTPLRVTAESIEGEEGK